MTENEKNTEFVNTDPIETAVEESTPVADVDGTSSSASVPEGTELPAEPPWERDKVLEEDDLDAWIDADLARSGLTRDDIEIEPFKPEGKLVKRSNGGYKIIYRNFRGERFLGTNG